MSYKKSLTWARLREQLCQLVLTRAKMERRRHRALTTARYLARMWGFEEPADQQQAENFIFDHRRRIVKWLGGVQVILTAKQKQKILQGAPIQGIEQYMTHSQVTLYRAMQAERRKQFQRQTADVRL